MSVDHGFDGKAEIDLWVTPGQCHTWHCIQVALQTYMEHGLKYVVMSTLSEQHVEGTHLGQTEAEWLIIAVTDVTASTLNGLAHTQYNTLLLYQNNLKVTRQNNSIWQKSRPLKIEVVNRWTDPPGHYGG